VNRFADIPPLNAAAVLKKFGLRAEKGLGQNFLQDPAALERIALAAEILEDDLVLEIGPGVGSLTRYLACAARKVIAVELDPDLIGPLEAVLRGWSNVQVVQGDILKLAISSLIDRPGYLAAANIPYHITSAIIRRLLESQPKPRRVVLTVQKEVAERICAAAGDLSLLALSVQVYGKPRIVSHIPAGAFHPVPKVDSAILRIEVSPQPLVPIELLDPFFKLIKAGFGQKRKTLRNSLSTGLHMHARDAEALLLNAGIDPKRRAETLSIDEWQGLAQQQRLGQPPRPTGG
jgi:16S rRNA (adenine1518-N6/adenine1519-N6)-dimethyltransferase